MHYLNDQSIEAAAAVALTLECRKSAFLYCVCWKKKLIFPIWKKHWRFLRVPLTVCIPITISDNLLPWMGLFLQNTFAETIVVSQIWWWKSNTCTAFLNKYLRRCITLSLNLHLSSTQQVFNLSQFEFCRMLIQPREHYEHKKTKN